jgi:hypothetical protein
MTSLLERCHSANQDLAKIEAARQNAHARSQIQERAKEWTDKVSRLSTAHERANWVGVVPAEVPAYLSKREQLRKNATDASTRLQAGEDVSHLTADALWTRLLQSAEGAAEALEDAIKFAWQAAVQEQGTLAAPAELEAKVSPTPANREALANYSAPYATYKKLVGYSLPRSGQDRVALQTSVEQCRALLAKLDYDVPADVAAFFRAVDSNTATLSILTSQVLRWLKENGQLDRYLVRGAAK